MVLGVIVGVISCRTFGNEILNMSREMSSGLSLSAYFLAKNVADVINQVMYSLVCTVALSAAIAACR